MVVFWSSYQIKDYLFEQVDMISSYCIFISFIYFSDFNECPDGVDSHDCVTNATCTDSDGSHTCSCDAGFTGDGFVACSGTYT